MSRLVLDLLLVHGDRFKAPGSAEMVCLGARGRAAAKREIGSKAYARIEAELRKTYAITGHDGVIITVGYRTRRRRTL